RERVDEHVESMAFQGAAEGEGAEGSPRDGRIDLQAGQEEHPRLGGGAGIHQETPTSWVRHHDRSTERAQTRDQERPRLPDVKERHSVRTESWRTPARAARDGSAKVASISGCSR